MKHWCVLSAIGVDRPGLVAELAQLIYDCDANLDDSRMSILGTDFAVILLCSTDTAEAEQRLMTGAKHLEREHGLTILLRSLGGEPRPAVPAPGMRLYRIEAVLADRGVNIAELSTHSRPGPGGSPHYEMTIAAEVQQNTDTRELREALEAEADRLVVDVAIMPA
jgi:glycine cleavage system transcriptional repressor